MSTLPWNQRCFKASDLFGEGAYFKILPGTTLCLDEVYSTSITYKRTRRVPASAVHFELKGGCDQVFSIYWQQATKNVCFYHSQLLTSANVSVIDIDFGTFRSNLQSLPKSRSHKAFLMLLDLQRQTQVFDPTRHPAVSSYLQDWMRRHLTTQFNP